MKKNYILTARSSIPSCKQIRDAIEELNGNHYLITTNPTKVTGKVLFRYGNLGRIPGEETNFNSPEFITLAHDKLVFSRFCQDNNLYSPVYKTGIPTNYPVVIRKTLTGWGGIGIVVCKDEKEFLENKGNNFYWTDFVNTQFEVRVHLFDDKINRIYKKVKIDGDESELPIRNTHNDYHFALAINDKYPKVIELCTKLGNLFAEIGGHFSGVDLGYNPERKEYFIFEINSAPGLNSVNAKEYAKFFIDKWSE